MARLFIAVQPPEAVLDLVAALPRPAEPGVRYTTRDRWHITLRFLGEADVSAATSAFETIDLAATDAVLGPQVSRLGRDVVIVPVAGLDDLAASVEAATATVGQPPDPRPFTGHLTIARLRRRGPLPLTGAPIAASFPVDEVALVRSHLEQGGARHEMVALRQLRRSG